MRLLAWNQAIALLSSMCSVSQWSKHKQLLLVSCQVMSLMPLLHIAPCESPLSSLMHGIHRTCQTLENLPLLLIIIYLFAFYLSSSK